MSGQVQFRKAKRKAVKLRVALMGPAGGGKTYTSLALAAHMGVAPHEVFLVDSEVTGEDEGAQGSAEKYEGDWCRCAKCQGHGQRFEFMTALLPKGSQSPDDYCAAIAAAKAAGAKVLVLDSITHEWEACLNLVDAIKGQNKWAQGWGAVTPLHDRFMQAVLTFPGHVIATMRAKEKHEQQGKEIKSLGMLPVQRPGVEYEFDVVLFLDQSGRANVVKARAAVLENRVYTHPGKELAEVLLEWANAGGSEPTEADRLFARALELIGQVKDAEAAGKARGFVDEHRGDAQALATTIKRLEKLVTPAPAPKAEPNPDAGDASEPIGATDPTTMVLTPPEAGPPPASEPAPKTEGRPQKPKTAGAAR